MVLVAVGEPSGISLMMNPGASFRRRAWVGRRSYLRCLWKPVFIPQLHIKTSSAAALSSSPGDTYSLLLLHKSSTKLLLRFKVVLNMAQWSLMYWFKQWHNWKDHSKARKRQSFKYKTYRGDTHWLQIIWDRNFQTGHLEYKYIRYFIIQPFLL